MLEDVPLAMMLAVVLERDPESRPSEVDSPEESTRGVVHVDVEFRLGEACLDDSDPHPCLHRRLAAHPHQFDRTSSRDSVRAARTDRASEVVDRGQARSSDHVIADRDQRHAIDHASTLEPRGRGSAQTEAVQDTHLRGHSSMRDDTGAPHPERPDGRHVHAPIVLRRARERSTPQSCRGDVAEVLIVSHDDRDRRHEVVGAGGRADTPSRPLEV
ncbi:hypothetical protein [Curtobacterium sp. B8]|uniref:hypothetical protein n=1 Tax=Curtobacterium sp. B8 TaxID=95611 RepID=UPI0011D2947E|nr:hypothetical protein [Curtobacterium sp. B8]